MTPSYEKRLKKIEGQQYASPSSAHGAVNRSKLSERKKAKLHKRINQLARDLDVLRSALRRRERATSSWARSAMCDSYREYQDRFLKKTVGGFRRTRYRGRSRTQLAAYMVGAAYNLVRLSRLVPAA